MNEFKSAPIEHQAAFHQAVFGQSANPVGSMNPASESGIAKGPMIPDAVVSSPIKEKVKPHLAKSLIHSAVKGPTALGKV